MPLPPDPIAPRSLLRDGPPDARRTLVLAHGAGAPMDSPFLADVARGIAAAGIGVVRFELPYMAARREGTRRPPDRTPVLLRAWAGAIAAVRSELAAGAALAIGGKSLGGRIASMVADDAGVGALVCLGYPFHPPGRAATGRVEHLAELRTPALVVQGERDPFGVPDEVAGYALSPAIRVHWIAAGDHSLAPPARSGRSAREALAEAVTAVVEFLETTLPG